MKEEYKPYFEPESETASEDKLRELQFNKLKNVLNIVSRSNPFYRRKFQKHGVSVQEIKSLDDLRKIPFSYKEEFQKDQRGNPPFGTNLSEPLESYTRYHQTSGTTGLPLKWLDTEKSWRWRGKCAAMALWGAGLRPSDIVFFPFAFGPHVAFWGLFEGAQLAGALVIAGGGWNTLQRVKSIIENRVSIICCTPTYALRMAEVAEREGIDIEKSSVRITVTAGEPGALALGEEYRVVAYTKDGMGELKVQIEFAPGRDEKEISNMITKELRDQFELRIDVEGVSAGTLPRSDYKSRRFLDERV